MPKLEELQQTPGRHARRARSMRVSTSLAEINVVPLVDVMLVLLVIFMVTAPMMQQGFGVHLPQSRRSTAIAAPVTVSVPISFRQDGKVRHWATEMDNFALELANLVERRLLRTVKSLKDGY